MLNLLDVFGLNLALEKRIVTETTAKVLAVGLGWAAAEALSNEFLTLVMNASGEEFTWIYLQRSIRSNLNSLMIIAFTCLVWMYRRKNKFFYAIMMLLKVLNPLFFEVYLKGLISDWEIIII